VEVSNAQIKLDKRTSIRSAYDSGLAGAALELGKNEIRKGFAFSRVGRVKCVECLDVALVDFLKVAAKWAPQNKTDKRRTNSRSSPP
jgi:hypothetical protein